MIMNAPPAGGNLMVSPRTGVFLQTVFAIRAPMFSDDPQDYPKKRLFAVVPAADANILVAEKILSTSYGGVHIHRTAGAGTSRRNRYGSCC